MSDQLHDINQKLADGQILSQPEMEQAFIELMEGRASPVQMAAFMIALRVRGETPQDIAAGASIMRQKALTIKAPPAAIDIVGTGGDKTGSWNISTAAALVVAGAGVPVAKHGNKAVSSKSGAADVLSELGIQMDCALEQVQAALEQANICFLMAPRHHSALRHVGPVRVELGMRTIFNLLGPLSNPALVNRALIGVYDARWCRPFAEALDRLGTTHAWIVHGSDGMDELTSTGPSKICQLKDGKIEEFELSPADFGMAEAKPADLRGGSAAENAAALRAVLSGTEGPYRDIVMMNAAAALVATGHAEDLQAGLQKAVASVDGGAAAAALNQLIAITAS
jgi:anthranilate phosphoribosyltransferase